ncbi:MAG: hypothetical protein SGILL_010237, partial [Bacillariaceae sp.]
APAAAPILAPNAEPLATTHVPTPVQVAPAPEATAAALAAAAAAVPQVNDAASVGSDLAAPEAPPKATKGSKKKKNQVTVTMATAQAPQSSNQGAQGENTGRWTAEEHRLFLQGLELHGKGWKKIAGLIKSRTVVQIRTHAQKYFQKLAKAKQNGEEGEILMDARGGATSIPSVTTTVAQTNKRRKQTSGTKRKAIQSVVASAQREAKRTATGDSMYGITTVAPVLAPYILPVADPMENDLSNGQAVPSITTHNGTISGTALEDSLYVYHSWREMNFLRFPCHHLSHIALRIVLYSTTLRFRFLTPTPVANVNEVARQAGANPITLPGDNLNATPAIGETSPTGVSDFNMYSSWTDSKDTPSWYAKGSDVDALLDVADSLEWLVDTGDLNETYSEAANAIADGIPAPTPVNVATAPHAAHHSASMNSLPRIDSTSDAAVPPLPSLFDGATDEPNKKLAGLPSSHSMTNLDEHLQVFDNTLEEHDFVSTILDDNGGESTASLAALTN